jgi:hypothetical protein
MNGSFSGASKDSNIIGAFPFGSFETSATVFEPEALFGVEPEAEFVFEPEAEFVFELEAEFGFQPGLAAIVAEVFEPEASLGFEPEGFELEGFELEVVKTGGSFGGAIAPHLVRFESERILVYMLIESKTSIFFRSSGDCC